MLVILFSRELLIMAQVELEIVAGGGEDAGSMGSLGGALLND